MESLYWLGYPGLFISSFLAATILPFSSEALLTVLLIKGYDPVSCLIIATAGNWLGGLTNYWIGYKLKWGWLKRFFRVTEESVYKHKHKVDRFQWWLAFFTWIPFVGDLFAIALGVFKTRFWPVALLMLLGKGLRYVVWGYLTIFGKNALSLGFSTAFPALFSHLSH